MNEEREGRKDYMNEGKGRRENGRKEGLYERRKEGLYE
jgi:hypothetical protein